MSLTDKLRAAGYDAVAIVGPTASGKTGLSVALASELNGEIISCDSMQIYRGMDIATAKVTEEEMKGIPHHLIDICDPSRIYSCADYASDATRAAEEIISRGRLPIFCGGTGLYLESVMRGGYSEECVSDMSLRAELSEYAKKNGNTALHKMLFDIDPDAAESIHENNVKRVIRAIEIAKCSGKTKTEHDRENTELSGMRIFVISLNYEDRQTLYSRIEKRVDMMLSQGLICELEKLMADDSFMNNTTAVQAIGYKEFFPYFRDEATLDSCVEQLKCATRRYAKRQLTWFSRREYAHTLWCDAEGEQKSAQTLLSDALSLIDVACS